MDTVRFAAGQRRIMKISHVEIVEYGVQNYPEGFEGWRFYRIEYWTDDGPYAVKECHVWLPMFFDAMVLEEAIDATIIREAKEGDN
jgi:hypothetical protein